MATPGVCHPLATQRQHPGLLLSAAAAAAGGLRLLGEGGQQLQGHLLAALGPQQLGLLHPPGGQGALQLGCQLSPAQQPVCAASVGTCDVQAGAEGICTQASLQHTRALPWAACRCFALRSVAAAAAQHILVRMLDCRAQYLHAAQCDDHLMRPHPCWCWHNRCQGGYMHRDACTSPADHRSPASQLAVSAWKERTAIRP